LKYVFTKWGIQSQIYLDLKHPWEGWVCEVDKSLMYTCLQSVYLVADSIEQAHKLVNIWHSGSVQYWARFNRNVFSL